MNGMRSKRVWPKMGDGELRAHVASRSKINPERRQANLRNFVSLFWSGRDWCTRGSLAACVL